MHKYLTCFFPYLPLYYLPICYVQSLSYILCEDNIYNVISLTSRTLYGLFYWPLPQGIYHLRLTLYWIPLLIFLRAILEEMCLKYFLPLIHISLLIIIRVFLKNWLSLFILIQIFDLPYGFLQSLGILKLDFILTK
jgi:hypothetical protein